MSRIKIEEQDAYPFRTELVVRVSDLNYGAHLGYDSLLTLAHQARLEMLSNWSVTETDLGDGQTGIVASDAALIYRGEAFLNDVLIFEICPVKVGMVSFRLAHRVRKKDGTDVALIEIGFAGFNYKERSPAKLPSSFTAELNEMIG